MGEAKNCFQLISFDFISFQNKGADELMIVGPFMIGMFLLAGGLIAFFLTYQKRLLKQQKEHQEKEAEYQRQLLRANFLSQEKERKRIGSDLHDEVGAMLTTTRMYFKHLAKNLGKDNEELQDKTDVLLEQSIETVRRVSHDLRPVVLEKLGLIEAIQNSVDQVNIAGEINVHFHHNIQVEIGDEYALNWYRIVQELLNNTLKHANASEVTIDLISRTDRIQLNYADNGKGIKDNELLKKGLGIQSLKSRMSLMAGELIFGKDQSKGFNATLISDNKQILG